MPTNFNVGIVESASASDLVGSTTWGAGIAEACDATDQAAAFLAAPLTPTVFRTRFPGFANPGLYPEAQVAFYIDLAGKMLVADRWGNVFEEGQQLFAAHFLALDQLARVAGVNSVPGTAVGVLTNGSVDKVSYTRDVQSIMEDNAGHWGMTTYGLMFLRFARMMGTGPLQVGLPFGANAANGGFVGGINGYLGQGGLSQSASASGWPGPMPGMYGW